jgi:hypothetical protein
MSVDSRPSMSLATCADDEPLMVTAASV